MTEVRQEVTDALRQIDTGWSDDRTVAAWHGLRKKRARRAAARAAITVIALVAVGYGAYGWLGGDSDNTGVAQEDDRDGADGTPQAPPAPKRELALAQPQLDLPSGSSVVRESDDAVVTVEPATSNKPAALRIVSGKSRVKVEDDSSLEVVAGPVALRAYAVEFSIARYESRTEIEVYRGQLVLQSGPEKQTVSAGERLALEDKRETPVDRRTGQGSSRLPDWKSLAKSGHLASAYEALARSRAPARVEDLLLAADVSRGTGHHEAAVDYLSRIVRKHKRDSRAPLAAFTMGRVLLDNLKRPARAARSFRNAREMAPSGALAQDALAREVEALGAAGRHDEAVKRAELYLQRHPDGHRARAMRDFLRKR